MAGASTSASDLVPNFCSRRAMESTTAGTVPPLGPLPGMTPSGRKSLALAAFGAVPWPHTIDTLPLRA